MMNSDYRLGYLDAIFGEPRAKNATFMYHAGYDNGLADEAEEQATQGETA